MPPQSRASAPQAIPYAAASHAKLCPLSRSWTLSTFKLSSLKVGPPIKTQEGGRSRRDTPEIAIDEIDRFIASGTRFGCVLADAAHVSSGSFRQSLSKRGLLWAVGLSRRQNVYPADIALTFPVGKARKRRKYHVPDRPPVSAEVMLATGK